MSNETGKTGEYAMNETSKFDVAATLMEESNFDRRGFLKKAGLAGIGAMSYLYLADVAEALESIWFYQGKRQDFAEHDRDGRTPGIDWEVSETEPYTEVTPMAAGEVIDSGYYRGSGNHIIIYHGLGFFTTYAHLHRRFIEKNKKVGRNVVIGEAGNTGTSAHGNWHLHNTLIVPLYTKGIVKYGDYICADPEKYGKNPWKLNYWDGTDLDSEFEKNDEEAKNYVDNIMNNLTYEMFWKYNEEYVIKKISYPNFDSVDKRIIFIEKKIKEKKLPYQNENPEEILKRFEYYKKQRPILSKPFVNPDIKDLYDYSLKKKFYEKLK